MSSVRRPGGEKKTMAREQKAAVARAEVAGAMPAPALTSIAANKHIYAQLDRPEGRTIGSVSSSLEGVVGGARSRLATSRPPRSVGAAIAEAREGEKGIPRSYSTETGFLYHGRVKALAEAAREAGLKF